uniref:RBR-type E3 ubiquitin transferase n=1 Tax=Culicoides sonorensis TaxID=179676 RepID=A0A336KHR8_CULSO
MRKNTIEFRNSVLNHFFIHGVRNFRNPDQKNNDDENPSISQNNESIIKKGDCIFSETEYKTIDENSSLGQEIVECILCCTPSNIKNIHCSSICNHTACKKCFEKYLTIEITESRTDIECPQCNALLHPNDIRKLLENKPEVIKKYEEFMVRRVLLTDPDSRWCPAPDCCYAVVASSCASCPRLVCESPGCDMEFCYHCKEEWHPDQTCDRARILRQRNMNNDVHVSPTLFNKDDIKPCPRCQVLIVKMDDGSCNHMVCAVCGSEFCWLCMKIITDLHFLSPSGCTFWGKKPWSKKKKLLWQIGTIFGAPIGIGLLACIAIPAVCIGIPIWVGRKIHSKFKTERKRKRNVSTFGAVVAAIVVSPIIAALSVVIGVPILLFYVYGIVPLSLCRAGCSTIYNSNSQLDDCENGNLRELRNLDDSSKIKETSIGDISMTFLSANTVKAEDPTSSNVDFRIASPDSIISHKVEVVADVNHHDEKS